MVLLGMSEHICHAEGCTIAVAPEMLMCRKHWRMVPYRMQRAVWNTYQPGQCDLDPPPSREWLNAAHDAIRTVAIKEGR
jgi:hypothetical protein